VKLFDDYDGREALSIDQKGETTRLNNKKTIKTMNPLTEEKVETS